MGLHPTPKSELRHFEAELLEQNHWTAVQEGLEARLIEHPDGDGKEKYVLCRSSQRAEKERAMLATQMDRLTLELMKIDHRLRKLEGCRKAFWIHLLSRSSGETIQ